MRTSYEYIVAGCGGIGSAAAYWLARAAGGDVLGLERFALGHVRGGSQDHSRIIRLSYHAPEYTALTPHTYEAYAAAEEESGVRLVWKTGGLDLEHVRDGGPKFVNLYASAMREAGIPHDELSAGEVMERYPQFRLHPDVRGVYQRDGGLVDAARANAVHINLARARGATVLDNTPVRGVRPAADGVEVVTDVATFSARRLVVTSGAWTNDILRHVGMTLPITVTEEQVTYFQSPRLREFAPDRFPIWIWHGEGRDCFYGFPVYGEVATKAGQDVGGDVVGADTRTFEPNARAAADLRRFLERNIPDFLGPELYTKTCLYDMPPDRNFVVDTLPGLPQITVINGAGHAFKFAGLLGRIASELATEGRTRFPIDAFTLNRPALTEPSYEPAFAM